MQSPTRVSSWCSSASPPSLSCCTREGWKKMEEVAERGLDSLSPLSLCGRLPLAQRLWKDFSPSWALLVSVIFQAVEQEWTYLFCNRQPRCSHPLIRLLQLSQTHPCPQIQTWPLGAFSNQPCLLWLKLFPHLLFFQVGVCNLLISRTPPNGVKQAALISSSQIFHPSVTGIEHQIATMRN